MKWIRVEEQLPTVNPDTGESEWVFVYPGSRCFPQIAQYSDGTWSNAGWHIASDFGAIKPLYSIRKKQKVLTYTHWAEIEYPQDQVVKVEK